jgi:hypothetical protein
VSRRTSGRHVQSRTNVAPINKGEKAMLVA